MRCSSTWFKSVAGFALLFALAGVSALAEDGSAAWLRYAPIPHPEMYKNLPSHIVVYGDTATDDVAGTELQKGLSSLLGRQFTLERPSITNGQKSLPHDAILVQAIWEHPPAHWSTSAPAYGPQGYSIAWGRRRNNDLLIEAEKSQGALYGYSTCLKK